MDNEIQYFINFYEVPREVFKEAYEDFGKTIKMPLSRLEEMTTEAFKQNGVASIMVHGEFNRIFQLKINC